MDDKTGFLYFNTTLDADRGNGTCNQQPFLDPLSITFFSIVYLTICAVGLLGNTLVIYVVLRFSKMQTVTNIYIVNLAIADECFLIGIPFLVTTYILKSWKFGGDMCRIYMTSIGINQFTSSTFITIMSVDRYVAICHPITSPKIRTSFISTIVAFTAWIVSVIMILPIILYSDAVSDDSDPEHFTCNIIWPHSSQDSLPLKQLMFTLYSFVLTFAVPVTIIFICYFFVIVKLRTVGPKNKSKEKKRSHRKVTKLIMTVITVYIFCWLPYWIMQLVLIFQTSNVEDGKAVCPKTQGISFFVLSHLVANILSNANSAMNPLLYAFLSDNFKKSFVKACFCGANKDATIALQRENSVFPKRAIQSGSEKHGPRDTTILIPEDENMQEEAQLMSKSDSSNAKSNTTSYTEVNLDKDKQSEDESSTTTLAHRNFTKSETNSKS